LEWFSGEIKKIGDISTTYFCNQNELSPFAYARTERKMKEIPKNRNRYF